MKIAAIIAAVSFCFAGAAFAKVDIGGAADQSATIKNGAVVNLGLGDATQKINNVQGGLTQKLSVENGALVNLGLGNATQQVNNISDK
jgi:acyl CoA:acetate/3-ketoacid CoA transferase beta subunit